MLRPIPGKVSMHWTLSCWRTTIYLCYGNNSNQVGESMVSNVNMLRGILHVYTDHVFKTLLKNMQLLFIYIIPAHKLVDRD